MTDDVHASPALEPPRPRSATRRSWRDVVAATSSLLRRLGPWLGLWARRLAGSPFLWAGAVLGFVSCLPVWLWVLLLGGATWVGGAWMWHRHGRTEVLALGIGLVLGWVPWIVVVALADWPAMHFGPPGVVYDLFEWS
ncbi:hypothetical protein L1785_17345 [Antribacter sp. KLBMP9083]|uniref:Uncharacterized protein n=1 Tax=Antribacter soli TaxID=2910976 RepID=A0AA41QFY3_9MICO|nr:hypothetical protein [Antribacter soli]MCF4122748.1 hypothetical protein [Antribacter soli]